MNNRGLRLVQARDNKEERPNMKCPSAEELTLHAEARLRGMSCSQAYQQLEEHLERCPTCADQVRGDELLLRQLRSLGNHGLATPVPDADFFAELHEKTMQAAGSALETREQAEGVTSLASARWRRRKRVQAAAVLAAAACLALFLARPATPPAPMAPAMADAVELDAMDELLGTGLFAQVPIDEDLDLLEQALTAEVDTSDMSDLEDSLPLLEGLVPSGLSDDELAELLDDWEIRG